MESRYQRLMATPLPRWSVGPLVTLGTLFVFLPIAIAVGGGWLWFYYALGWIGAGLGFLSYRRQRRRVRSPSA